MPWRYDFSGRPFTVRFRRNPKHWPQQLQTTLCKTHETKLSHIECMATLTWKEITSPQHKHALVHKGYQNPRPKAIRPPPLAMHHFEQRVLNAPTSKPKQLLIASHHNVSVGEIHSSI